ncbi:MAG: hypothetical protein ACW964_06280 [Candidatus Hodarchaeales archaeon]
MPLSTDEELTEIYDIRKQAYVDLLKDSGGFSMVKIDEIRASQDIKTVESLMEKKLQDIPISNWKKSWIHSFIREAYVIGSNAYLDYIATKIEIKITRKKALVQSKDILEKSPVEVLHETPKDFIEFIQNTMYKNVIEQFSFDKEMAESFVFYYFSKQRYTWLDFITQKTNKRAVIKIKQF